MKKGCKSDFIYLFNNDFSRNFKIIISFLATFMAGHLFIAFKQVMAWKINFLSHINSGESIGEFISQQGYYRFSTLIDRIGGYLMIWMVVGFMFIIIFSAIIWLREWYGNNRTIYTLMSLPIKRHTIILEKFCNVLLTGCMFISSQIICFFIDNIFMKLVLGNSIFKAEPLMQSVFSDYISDVLPGNLKIFILYFVMMVLAVSIIFNIIMIHRSVGIKGVMICLAIFAIIIVANVYLPTLFGLFNHEIIRFYLIEFIILIMVNYCSSCYLLKHRVHV